MARQLGIFPTMLAAYTKEGALDTNGLESLVEWYWKKGCDGIFAACHSSEIHWLSLEERVLFVTTVMNKTRALAAADQSRPPMHVVASGHVSDRLEDQVKELTAIAETGVEAVILITNRMDIANTTDDAWIRDLDTLIERLPADVSLGLYECPTPYKRLLTPRMLQAARDTGRFAFIKDTCCDPDMLRERLEILKGSELGLYNANAQTLLATWRMGADGYSSVMANFHPEIYKWLFDHQHHPQSELVQAFLSTAAFTEVLSYPATAKYYLREYEGVEIEPYSRVVDYTKVTPYQKGCLAQMKQLGDFIKRTVGIA